MPTERSLHRARTSLRHPHYEAGITIALHRLLADARQSVRVEASVTEGLKRRNS